MKWPRFYNDIVTYSVEMVGEDFSYPENIELLAELQSFAIGVIETDYDFVFRGKKSDKKNILDISNRYGVLMTVDE